MFTILIIIFVGICIGLGLRRRSGQVLHTEKAINATVSLLILLFGHSIGTNQSLLANLSTLGTNALIISLLGIIGSVVFVFVVEKLYFSKCRNLPVADAEEVSDAEECKSIGRLVLQSLRLPMILLSGVIVGMSGWITYPIGEGAYYVLCALAFQVGLSLGNRSDFMSIVQSIRPNVLLLPVCTIVGTLSFTMIASLIIGGEMLDTMIVSSGFGYYSLSSVIILDLMSDSVGEQAAVQLASMSLMVNMFRELVSLLLCSPIANSGKGLAAISVAGINSMDVCLPMIVSGRKNTHWGPTAIVHGICLEMAVPLLLGFLCR